MSNQSTATTDTSTDASQIDNAQSGTGTEVDWKAEAEKWKTQARKHEDRAKANAQAAKELEQVRQSSMTEQEKAVAQARAEARQEALREAGGRLVAAEFRAVAAGRLSDAQIAGLLEGLNVSAFVTEDGDVDAKRVAKFVDGIAPAEQETRYGFPDLGQGARGSTGGNGDMSALIRRAAGRT